MAKSQQGSIGRMVERLTIEENAPNSLAVTSVTRATTTATVTTITAHGYASGDYVAIAGAGQSAYNGEKLRITVTAPTTFTYQVAGSPASPATGAITSTYVSDPQGNRKIGWETHVEVPAEMIQLSDAERLAYGAMPALSTESQYHFRLKVRPDITHEMRVRWTQRWPASSPEHVLEIIGIELEGDGRQYMMLRCTG